MKPSADQNPMNGTPSYPAQGGYDNGYQQPMPPAQQHPAAHSAGYSNGTQPNANWQSGQ